jgi:DNA-binding transcriptional regulator YiaG
MTDQGYHYVESGLPNIFLANGVTMTETPRGVVVSIEHADELHHAIAMSIVSRPSPMTKDEFRFLRIELDLSQRLLADILDTTEKTLARWETGETKTIPGPVQNLLKAYYLDSKEEGRIAELLAHLATLDRKIVSLENRIFEFEGEEWHEAQAS